METIQLAVVDDDQLVVELLTDFFSCQEQFDVVITASSGNTFLEQLKDADKVPDMVLLDLRMEDGDGIAVTEELKKCYPSVKIIVLSSHARTSFTGYMLKLGVNAFLPKRIDKEDLLNILNEVNEKGFYFSADQVEVLRDQITSKSPKPLMTAQEKLNERELEVLELICRQHTAKEIADKLFVSVKAIESRKSNLLFKLGVKNTAGLIIYAIQHKLVNPDSIVLLD